MKKSILGLFICFILSFPAITFAGYVFEKEMDTGTGKIKMVYSIEGENKRIDVHQNGQMMTSMISAAGRQHPVFIMHEPEQYIVFTPDAPEKLENLRKSKMEEAIKELQKGKDKMSPQEMAIMDAMRKAADESNKKETKKARQNETELSSEDFSIKLTGKKKKIGKYKTKNVQVFYKGALFQNNWVTNDLPRKAIKAMNSFTSDTKLNRGRKTKTAQTMKELNDRTSKYGYPILTVAKLTPATKPLYGDAFMQEEQVPGEVKIEMKAVRKKKISKKEFMPPKNYKEVDLDNVK